MAATLTLPYSGELRIGLDNVTSLHPESNAAHYDELPGYIQEFNEEINVVYAKKGLAGINELVPQPVVDQNGMTFTLMGDPAEVVVDLGNPYATDLSSLESRFWGYYFHQVMQKLGVVGPDQQTPQVFQRASAARHAKIPLTLKELWRVAQGDVMPIVDKEVELIERHCPEASQFIGAGPSQDGYLLPFKLISAKRIFTVIAAYAASPPGGVPKHPKEIAKDVLHESRGVAQHLRSSKLKFLEPADKESRWARQQDINRRTADAASHLVNICLPLAFSRGDFVENLKAASEALPSADIGVIMSLRDRVCNSNALSDKLDAAGIRNQTVPHEGHGWLRNIPYSLGKYGAGQVMDLLMDPALAKQAA